MTTPASAAATRHALHWFEIPVLDMDRAQSFYEALLGTRLRRETIGPQTLAVFDYASEGGVGGCLIRGETVAEPSAQGSLVYLGAEPSLDAVLAKVESLGGRIATPKVTLPNGMGSFAHVIDSEGNRIGLHEADRAA